MQNEEQHETEWSPDPAVMAEIRATVASTPDLSASIDTLSRRLQDHVAEARLLVVDEVAKAQEELRPLAEKAAAALRELEALHVEHGESISRLTAFNYGELREKEILPRRAAEELGTIVPALSLTLSNTIEALRAIPAKIRALRGMRGNTLQYHVAEIRNHATCGQEVPRYVRLSLLKISELLALAKPGTPAPDRIVAILPTDPGELPRSYRSYDVFGSAR